MLQVLHILFWAHRDSSKSRISSLGRGWEDIQILCETGCAESKLVRKRSMYTNTSNYGSVRNNSIGVNWSLTSLLGSSPAFDANCTIFHTVIEGTFWALFLPWLALTSALIVWFILTWSQTLPCTCDWLQSHMRHHCSVAWSAVYNAISTYTYEDIHVTRKVLHHHKQVWRSNLIGET